MAVNLNSLYDVSNKRIKNTELKIKRYLHQKIDWRDRLICISGARGVGKTTLMLQHMKEAFKNNTRALYISLDNLSIFPDDLVRLVEEFELEGGTHLFLDEVHKMEHWQIIIKNIYDDYPDIHVAYTGSNLLEIKRGEADLSRRQIVYGMAGLSFREYIEFEKNIKFSPMPINDILSGHVEIATEISDKINVLQTFEKYIKEGYYPFYKEIYAGYEERLTQVINQVIEQDVMTIENVSPATIKKLKKMLVILAKSCPQTPNMSELYRQLETDRNLGIKMLDILERAALLSTLTSNNEKLKNMSKPEKIYCNNTNLMQSLVVNPDRGTLRETFFINQMRAAGHRVSYPPKGDFLVDDSLLFEIGGKNKSFEQIADEKDSFLAVGDTVIGRKNRIPLWMFGMMY